MATFVKDSLTLPAREEPEPLCDAHSVFGPDGFALPVDDGKKRAWVPLWGGTCVRCGVRC